MRKSMIRTFMASAAVVLSLSFAPGKADAVVVLNGCGGTTFGSACGLSELLAGGSFGINGTQFSNWTLQMFGRELNTSVIRVDPLDSFTNPGFTLVDTGATLRAADGDGTSNILSFNATTPLRFRDNTLAVQFGQITNPGEFTYAQVSETVFNSTLSLIGNKDVLCDTSPCANTTGFDSASFSNQSSLLVFTNIDVFSETLGDVAQISSITVRFAQQVSEPQTLVLLGIGIAIVVFSRRRQTS